LEEVAALAVAAGVANDGERSLIMKATTLDLLCSRVLALVSSVSFSLLLLIAVSVPLSAQTSGTSIAKQKTFATAEDAANALVDAAEKSDMAALSEILGPNSWDIIHTPEPARDREILNEFAVQARIKLTVSLLPKNPRRAFLSIGPEDWPFPVPIVKQGGKWTFDANAGRQEILHRRIGRNELDVIQICRGFVEAQHEYALVKRAGSGVNQYAQRIISTPGTQDGLAWRNADGTWTGPIGERVARAIERGYTSRSEPFHGYLFKVLKGQGPAAPLGEMDFVVKGAMIGGFALIAVPAQYRMTGVKTFMVSHDGVVYEKDLGPNSLEIWTKIDRFNPDKTWTPVVDE
jgi:DUF2950 family protein